MNSKLLTFNYQLSTSLGFTLVELMISIAIIAILTAAAIPSFTDFSKSQTLTQNFKTLKSDLRIAQSRSISGATVAGAAKAWGIYFDTGSSGQYTIIACTPAANLADYPNYRFGIPGSICTTTVKTVNLGSQVKINSIGGAASPLSLVFDSQNGAAYGNGSQLTSGNITIILSYADGTGGLTTTINPGGGISD